MKILARLALGAAALAGLALAVLLLQPRLLLNSRTAAYAARRFAVSYRPSWQRLSLDVRSPGLLTKRVVLEADEFCVDAPDLSVVGCLETFALDATIRLGRPLISVRRVERLALRARDLRVELPPAGRAATQLIPAWAARMTLGTVEIDAPRAVVASSSGTTTVGLTARFRSSEPGPLRAHLYAVVKGTGPAPGVRWDTSLTLDTDLFRSGRLTRLEASARVRGGGLGLDASAGIEPGGGVYALKGAVAVTSEAGGLRRAALEDCAGKASILGRADLDKADLSCRIVLQPARLGIGPGPLPQALTGSLTASTARRGRLGRRPRYATKAAARVGPATGYGGFMFTIDADFEGPEGALSRNGRARAGAAIADFGELARFLDGTGYALPAPLNALDGELSAEASVESRAGDRRRKVEYAARTNLTSAAQALKVAVSGTASMPQNGGRVRVDAVVDLRKAVFHLPRLELKGAPPPSAADYDVVVRTSTPAVLTTSLLKSPVPISLDLRARPEGLRGEIKIESFDMELFGRRARIDHLTLKPGPAGTAAALDGRIAYRRGGVTVDILLAGSADKPEVSFESRPPRAREELAALVLYGRDLKTLDARRKAGAANASAAIMEGPFSLAPLLRLLRWLERG